jgi:hypothetical protein
VCGFRMLAVKNLTWCQPGPLPRSAITAGTRARGFA